MTKEQADAAVAVLRAKYPDAAVESESDLEDDVDEAEQAKADYSVAFGGIVADTLDEIADQVSEDFASDPGLSDLIRHVRTAGGGLIESLHDDDPDMQTESKQP